MLIACPDCGKQVSTNAVACPSCGCPVTPEMRAAPVADLKPAPTRDTVLMQVRPSWWNFSWHLAVLLIVLPLVILYLPSDWWSWAGILLLAWGVFSFLHSGYHRKSFVMWIYPDRVTVVEGFLSKERSDFFINDIRSIDVRQSLWGRIVNIGDLTISTSASTEASEEAAGVPGPNRIKELLISQRRQSSDD